MMLCSISGEVPKHPVVSVKSGHVFEKHVIETYLQDNTQDPVNGEPLSKEDLIEVKTPNIVPPRAPTQTSIPALLSTFQNEWDAIALQTFQLKKQLAQTRQELSVALYDFEGALRVLDRVSKERDEARDALARLKVGDVPAHDDDGMEVDVVTPPEDLIAIINDTHDKLHAQRRKRAVPKGWMVADDVRKFALMEDKFNMPEVIGASMCTALAQVSDGNSEGLVLHGQEDGTAVLFDGDEAKAIYSAKNPVTDGLIWKSNGVVCTLSGEIHIFDKTGAAVKSWRVHAGAAMGISLHPSGSILASVGEDKSYILYNLDTLDSKPAARVFSSTEFTCCVFHPDGHLFAAGGKDGSIRIFEIATGTEAAAFETEGRVTSLSFAENGYWLASASAGVKGVTVWDLRKNNVAKTLEFSAEIHDIVWDLSAQYLAVAGEGSIAIHHYSKNHKTWYELLKKGVDAKKVAWDTKGLYLLVDGKSGPQVVSSGPA